MIASFVQSGRARWQSPPAHVRSVAGATPGLGQAQFDPFFLRLSSSTVNPRKLETFSRTNSAGIPYALLVGIEAVEFPTFWLLL